jgi:hypothetical protein
MPRKHRPQEAARQRADGTRRITRNFARNEELLAEISQINLELLRRRALER